MSSPNFQSVLNTKADAIEKPKPYPVGTYLCVVDGPVEFTTIGQKQTDAAILQLKIIQPGPDVDMAAVAEAGGVAGKRLRHTIFLTADSAWRAKQFLVEHLGLEAGTKSLGELFAEVPGRQVMVTVKHRTAQDGSAIYAEVGGTAKV